MSISWSIVEPSLSRFSRKAIQSELETLLNRRLPKDGRLSGDWKVRRPILDAVNAIIGQHTGAWYPAGGLMVYNEQLGGACSCHSFCYVDKKESLARKAIVERSAAGVLTEVERIHDYYAALRDFFDGLTPLPADDAERLVALEEISESLVDLVILHTDVHDCWYPLIISASVWMSETLGMKLSPNKLEARLERIVYAHCTSWMAPDAKKRKSLHADMAEAMA